MYYFISKIRFIQKNFITRKARHRRRNVWGFFEVVRPPKAADFFFPISKMKKKHWKRARFVGQKSKFMSTQKTLHYLSYLPCKYEGIWIKTHEMRPKSHWAFFLMPHCRDKSFTMLPLNTNKLPCGSMLHVSYFVLDYCFGLDEKTPFHEIWD